MISGSEIFEKVMPLIGILVFILLVYLLSRIGYSALTAKKKISAFCLDSGFKFIGSGDPKIFREFLYEHKLLERLDASRFRDLLYKDFGDFSLLSMLVTFDSRGYNESNGRSTSKISGGYFVLVHFKHLCFPEFILRNKKKAPWDDVLKKNRFSIPGGHRINESFNFYLDDPAALIRLLNDKTLDHLANYKDKYLRILGNGSFLFGTEDVYTLNSANIIIHMITTFKEIAQGISDTITEQKDGENDKENFDKLVSFLIIS
jgi:hypothetical protein